MPQALPMKKPAAALASPKQRPPAARTPPRKKPRSESGPPHNVLSQFFVLKTGDHISTDGHEEQDTSSTEVSQKKAQEALSKQELELKKAEVVFQKAEAKFKKAEAEFKESQNIFTKVQHATTESRRCVQVLAAKLAQAREAEKLALDFQHAQGPAGAHKHSFAHHDVDNGGSVSFRLEVDFQRKAADQVKEDAVDLREPLHTNVSHEVEWFLADLPNEWKSFSSESVAQLFGDLRAEWDKLQFSLDCLSTDILERCENGVCEPISEVEADEEKHCFHKVFQRLASWLKEHEQKQVAVVLIRKGRSRVERPNDEGLGLSIKPGEEECDDPFEFCFRAIFYFKVAGSGVELFRFEVSRKMEGCIHG
eukprot:TRINITY_DN94041_c0_g1_i1.p1 TRINITY_DN94041_c0_g1~~TRINITY_DN94041_c0_g1_i1.p1  ORF type:complete len:365 (+),score=66.88 TRINITY_DN94041_c0_g1_i1:61-1155(+)